MLNSDIDEPCPETNPDNVSKDLEILNSENDAETDPITMNTSIDFSPCKANRTPIGKKLVELIDIDNSEGLYQSEVNHRNVLKSLRKTNTEVSNNRVLGRKSARKGINGALSTNEVLGKKSCKEEKKSSNKSQLIKLVINTNSIENQPNYLKAEIFKTVGDSVVKNLDDKIYEREVNHKATVEAMCKTPNIAKCASRNLNNIPVKDITPKEPKKRQCRRSQLELLLDKTCNKSQLIKPVINTDSIENHPNYFKTAIFKTLGDSVVKNIDDKVYGRKVNHTATVEATCKTPYIAKCSSRNLNNMSVNVQVVDITPKEPKKRQRRRSQFELLLDETCNKSQLIKPVIDTDSIENQPNYLKTAIFKTLGDSVVKNLDDKVYEREVNHTATPKEPKNKRRRKSRLELLLDNERDFEATCKTPNIAKCAGRNLNMPVKGLTPKEPKKNRRKRSRLELLLDDEKNFDSKITDISGHKRKSSSKVQSPPVIKSNQNKISKKIVLNLPVKGLTPKEPKKSRRKRSRLELVLDDEKNFDSKITDISGHKRKSSSKVQSPPVMKSNQNKISKKIEIDDLITMKSPSLKLLNGDAHDATFRRILKRDKKSNKSEFKFCNSTEYSMPSVSNFLHNVDKGLQGERNDYLPCNARSISVTTLNEIQENINCKEKDASYVLRKLSINIEKLIPV